MPLQNRVDPYGDLHAVAARGAWTGNRGVLHDGARRIVRPWRLERWITCALEFKGRQREVFTPGRWTELFFLDEATALAAGHRPCAECRRPRYEAFRAAWTASRIRPPVRRVAANEIDRVLHGERLDRRGAKKIWQAELASLPDGTIVEHGGRPHLARAGALLPWSFSGYGAAVRIPPAMRLAVLTPPSTVAALRAGYAPEGLP